MPLIHSPCKDCERREAGCHARCPDYISYEKALKAANDKVYKNKMKYKTLNDLARNRKEYGR